MDGKRLATPGGLRPDEVQRLVYKYIGVTGGYLGNFT
jgi:hypothetical protein